jgi:hypothetical protein
MLQVISLAIISSARKYNDLDKTLISSEVDLALLPSMFHQLYFYKNYVALLV